MSKPVFSSKALVDAVNAIPKGFGITLSIGSLAISSSYGSNDEFDYDDVFGLDKSTKVLGDLIPSNIFAGSALIDDVMPLLPLRGGNLPTGGCIIAGGPDRGKTPAIKAIYKAVVEEYGPESAVLLRYGEPLPGYITDPVELLQMMMLAIIDPKVRLIAIDSLKDVMGQMKGQLMARGIPRGFFVVFSQWSAIAAALGKTIITPLNVSTDSEEAISEVQTATSSNSTAAFTVGASTDNRITYEGVARTGDGKKRAVISFTVEFDDNGQPELVDGMAATNAQVSSVNVTTAPSGNPVSINLAQRMSVARALTRHIKTIDSDEGM